MSNPAKAARNATKSRSSTRGSDRGDNARMVFYALLQAEHWLFVASISVDERPWDLKRRTLNDLRQSVARSLEGLQPAVYMAFERSAPAEMKRLWEAGEQQEAAPVGRRGDIR